MLTLIVTRAGKKEMIKSYIFAGAPLTPLANNTVAGARLLATLLSVRTDLDFVINVINIINRRSSSTLLGHRRTLPGQ